MTLDDNYPFPYYVYQSWTQECGGHNGVAPMPFVVPGEESKIYLPEPITVYFNNQRIGSCTSACPQFVAYSSDANGYRIISKKTKCPYIKCNGREFYCDGKNLCEDGIFLPADARSVQKSPSWDKLSHKRMR